MTVNIAIDGPAGAGKSTIAKAAAKQLGYIYVDTGALYRAIALACLRSNTDLDDATAVEKMIASINVRLSRDNTGAQIVLLSGEDVSPLIRTPEVSMAASKVSAIPTVREYLLDLQRDIACENNVIMDGRDIGTVVLPDAQIKIFLTASPEIRAKRRFDELILKGEQVNFDDVLSEVKLRDYNDSHRAIAPLKPAEDSILVDTSDIGLEDSIKLLINTIEENLK